MIYTYIFLIHLLFRIYLLILRAIWKNVNILILITV